MRAAAVAHFFYALFVVTTARRPRKWRYSRENDDFVIPDYGLWTKADRFACQCFCQASEYTVNNYIAQTAATSFGLTALPIPAKSESDIVEWLDNQQRYSVIAASSKRRLPQRIQEFRTGTLVIAPPTTTTKEREKLLGELSGGEYLKLKTEYELTGDFAVKKRLRSLEETYGIILTQTRRKKELYIQVDTTRYSSTSQKVRRWTAVCRKACRKAAHQQPKHFHFFEHTELSFLKLPTEPFSEGNIFSDEFAQAGEAGFVPLGQDLVPRMQDWISKVSARFSPLIQALSKPHNLPGCNSLWRAFMLRYPINGRLSSWAELNANYGILRSPEEIYSPLAPAELLRLPVGKKKRLGPVVNMRRRPFRVLDRSPPLKRVNVEDTLDLEPEAAIRKLIVAQNRNLVQWPRGTPVVTADHVTPQFLFTVIVQRADSGELAIITTINGRPTRLKVDQEITREGNEPGNPPAQKATKTVFEPRIDFLGLLFTNEEFAAIKTQIHNVILGKWAPHILSLYAKHGLQFAIDVEIDDDEGPDDEGSDGGEAVEDDVDEKRSKRPADLQGALENLKRGLTAWNVQNGGPKPSQVAVGDPGAALLQISDASAAVRKPKNVYVNDFFTEERALPKRKRDAARYARKNPVEFMKFTFVGVFDLACWHEANTSGARTLFEPQNSLVFLMHPKNVEVMRQDGIRAKAKLTTDTAGLVIIGKSIGDRLSGVQRIARRVSGSFMGSIQEFCPNTYKIWYRVLFEIFGADAAVKGPAKVFRNTCELNRAATELGIAGFGAPGENRLYLSDKPAEREMTPYNLGGGKLATRVGERFVKCFGLAPPSATIIQLSAQDNKLHQWKCSDVPLMGRYVFADQGVSGAAFS